MIKKFTMNKVVIICMYIILISIFYLIPTNNIKTSTTVEENKLDQSTIYLLDNDNYVSKVIFYFDKNTITDEIKYKLDILINGIDYMNNFYPLIPKNTKVNSVKVDKDNVYIDFSKDLLKVNKYLEDKMIEAIIFSISDINGINNIYLSVEEKELTNLPNSNKEIQYPLNRHYGINKKYDINSLNNLEKTTVFFSKNDNNESYYVPVTLVNNDNSDKINIIVEELKSSINSQNNLYGLVNQNLNVSNYNIEKDKMTISFNNDITDSETLNVITYSIFENYDINEIIINNIEKEDINIIRK